MLMAIKHEEPWHQVNVDPEAWCMVGTRPGLEQDVCDSFRRGGVRCYWPNYYVFGYTIIARRGSRRGRQYRSVMPGYLFMPLPTEDAFWHVAERHNGTCHPIKTFSGALLAIRNSDILKIRKIEGDLNTPQPKKTLHNFRPGQKVRFIEDLLTGWPPGKVARLADDGRIVIETELMGRSVPFTVWPHQIERM